ncbi:hypothetical protein QOZ80_2BG0201060 [Eleusine coracana subsp. coracana]|nr:hypothetical protein QOZ80_2BG0200960 [Eleusine coracana subsp. coracana]KAK3155271.1 hypothetical protein QOZ80_2BG0201060 [Eleusine coracana subsp. coracana]
MISGELDALSEIDGDFGSLWPLMEDAYRNSMEGHGEKKPNQGCDGMEKGTKMQGRRGGGGADKKVLTFEQVSPHFSMPIKQAARELNVGLTVLKKQCRKLGFARWPYRKVKSLETLINNVQELGKDTEKVDGHMTRAVVVMLEQTKKMIEERPAMMLDDNTKVLRQACFKENFKRKKLIGHGPCSGMTLLSDVDH